MGKKKDKKQGFSEDMDVAFKLWNPPVQCGDCYIWYNVKRFKECPICGGKEWVGSR